MKRCAEYFRKVLNCPSTVSDAAIDRLLLVCSPIANCKRSAWRYNPSAHHFRGLDRGFDTVDQEGTWKTTQKFGCPERLTYVVRQLYDGMMAPVTNNSAISEVLLVVNGVEQVCVPSPTLFSFMSSDILLEAYRAVLSGMRIAYRTDGIFSTAGEFRPTHGYLRPRSMTYS
nr:unnamed protein product [Spirometra erinaceieuropaei]